MELLGGYVDSDEEEEEGQAEQEQEQPAGVLPGFESYSRPKTDAAKPSLGTQPLIALSMDHITSISKTGCTD